jgi:hypothetical protein
MNDHRSAFSLQKQPEMYQPKTDTGSKTASKTNFNVQYTGSHLTAKRRDNGNSEN